VVQFVFSVGRASSQAGSSPRPTGLYHYQKKRRIHIRMHAVKRAGLRLIAA